MKNIESSIAAEVKKPRFGASKKDEAYREYALNAPPFQLLLHVCGPLAVYQALQQIFKLLDALMAAHISADAVSAISVLAQITAMLTAIGSGLAVGGSIKISEAYGQENYALVQKRTSTLYALAIVISALVAVVMVPFAVSFLRLLRTPETLIETGIGYFRVEILSMVVSFFNTVYIAIERSRGHSRQIMALNLAVILVKLGLSALFVYVLECGVVMIAAATLFGQLVILLYAMIRMPRDEGAFHFSAAAIEMKRGTLLPIFHLAYPVTIEKMLFNFGKVVVNSMAGFYGALTAGAMGVSNNISGLTTNWHAGMQDGASSVISQNRGAGKYKRTIELFYSLLLIDLLIGLTGFAAVRVGIPWLAQVFARSKNQFDESFCQMIIDIHRWEMIGYITLGINSAVTALLLGYGYVKCILWVNMARVFVFRIPVLWFLQNFTELGPEAVGVTMMVSNVSTGILSAVIAIPVLRSIRKRAAELEAGRE